MLVGRRLFDGIHDHYLQAPVVLIEDGIITAVGRRADFAAEPRVEVLDYSNSWIMPGFINAHAHLTFMYFRGTVADQMARSQTEEAIHAARAARTLLAQGTTFARDMGGKFGIPFYMRDSITEGTQVGPDVICCGQPLAVTGGHAWDFSLECDGPAAFLAGARQQLKEGADFVKVMASHDPVKARKDGQATRPEPTRGELSAAFKVAHDFGTFATCHVMGTEAISRALGAGVDIIEHGHYLTAEQAELMAKTGVFLTPTLSSYDSQTMSLEFRRGPAWAVAHRSLVAHHASAIRNAIAAGVSILAGTDSVGQFWEEVALLREYGMSAPDSLKTLTSNPARALGVADSRGTISPGSRADLVLLGADPLADALNLTVVQGVMKDGHMYDPNRLPAFELAGN